jgi:hypothetical protein
MSLGEFYSNTEKIVMNDLYDKLKSETKRKGKILYLFENTSIRMKDVFKITYLGIGNNIDEFIEHINEYRLTLGMHKYMIVNCRFSIRRFMDNLEKFNIFLRFVSDILRSGGYFVGFMMDMRKVNKIFMERTVLENEPYKLEYIPQYSEGEVSQYKIKINNENAIIMSDNVFREMCLMNGLMYVMSVNLEKIHDDYLDHIKLDKREKTFGFLNKVFVFRRM